MFSEILYVLRWIIDSIAVGIIVLVSLWSFYDIYLSIKNKTLIDFNAIRFRLGHGIILALEFMVGADIIESAINPDYYDLGILASIVAIRTFLSYFLNKELEALSPEQRNKLTQ